MAIKIITPADPEKLNPTRKFRCYKCNVLFTAQQSDFRYTGDQRDNDNLIKCPTEACNNHISWKANIKDDPPEGAYPYG